MLGISLEKITSSPLFVTSHPITEVESFFVRELLERIRGPSYLPCDLSGDSSPNINTAPTPSPNNARSEEHTSELQSRFDLVCRLLLEKKNITHIMTIIDATI